MRIAVVGAGGVGGYFGGKLAHAGIDTTFFVRGVTRDALRERGLRVESIHGDFTVDANTDPAGTFDAILMTVKAWQVAEAAQPLAPFIGPETVVVPLENGVDSPDVLAGIVGREHVLGGLCAIVAYAVAAGHIKHAASEPLVMFGELDNRVSERVERLRDAFVGAGIRTEVPPDIQRSMWTKFLFITPMSAIGALTRVPIGEWRAQAEVRSVVDAALRELLAIAAAKGIDLGADAIERTWQRYDTLAAASTSSLQRDVMEGKPSELDAQIGAVVRFGRELGIPTPVSETLYYTLLPQERRARGDAEPHFAVRLVVPSATE